MAPEHTIDIEGRRVEALGYARDLSWHNEKKRRVGVDEAADQPGTSDAIDLRTIARHPDRAAFIVARRQLVGANQGLTSFLPGLEPAFQRLCVDALVSEPSGRALAQLFPALAHDNHALAAVVRCPAADGTVIAPQRTRHQPWIDTVVVVDAHIDDSRRVREADLARELRNGDEGCSRHSVPFPGWECGRDLSAAASRGNRG